MTSSALIIILALPWPGNCQQHDEQLKQQFLNEAPAKWSLYLEKTSRLQGTMTDVGVTDNQNSRTELEYRSNKSAQLLIWQELAEGKMQGTAYVCNPDYSFILMRSSPTSAWVLSQIQIGTADQAPERIRTRLSAGASLRQTPIMLWNESIPDALKKKNFVIRKVSRRPNAGGNLVDIEFDYPNVFQPAHPNEFVPVQGGRITLNQQCHWCLHSFDLRLKSLAGTGTEKNTYEMTDCSSATPSLKKLHSVETWSLSTGKSMTTERELDFNLSQPSREPDDSVFRLSAFGLPEPVGITPPSKPTPRYVWLLSAAAILSVLAIAFRSIHRRRVRVKHPVAPPPAR